MHRKDYQYQKIKGFTLLELLVVVVMLGILALIAVPATFDVISRSKNTAVLSNAKIAEKDLTVELTVNKKQIDSGFIDSFISNKNDPDGVAGNGDEVYSPYSTNTNRIWAYSTVGGQNGQVVINVVDNSTVQVQAYGNEGLIYSKLITFDDD